MVAVAWGVFYRAELAAASILMWGAGDAAAALTGIPFGKHKVHCRFTDGKKSWEGSLAMLIVSFAIGAFVLISYKDASISAPVLSAGIGALIGTSTELFSPSEYDTITVPVMIIAALLIFTGL